MSGLLLNAQTIKEVTISQGNSFTDHLSLSTDNHDMDLMVKLIFDEEKNQLVVSLLSYRYLFVFREDARYGTIIHHNRLNPLDLPYITDFPEKGRFILSKEFRKSIPKPHKNYIFTKWISYTGLQQVSSRYKMVNDYIEQIFDITNHGNFATVTLGEVFVMDKTPTKKHPDDYTIVAGKNLNIEYRIKIERNPCFGLESEIELAKNNLSAVTEAFSKLTKLSGSGEMENEKELLNFNSVKSVLQKQFQIKNSDSKCYDLKSIWDKYDCIVDSISSLSCVLKVKEGKDYGMSLNLDPTEITTLARQIDRNVSRWLTTKDSVEKQDLVKECQDIIAEGHSIIGLSQGTTAEQKKAVALFHQAETYFRNTCGKKK